MAHVGKEHPWLLAPRDFFFGLHRVEGWGFWWGYSAMQIELMVVDAPVVVYGEESKFAKPSRKALERTNRKWREEHPDGVTKVDLTDVLAGRSVVGKRVLR